MKYLSLLLVISLATHSCSPQQNLSSLKVGEPSKNDSIWNKAKEKEHLLNRYDSTTWDKEQYLMDLEARSFLASNQPFEVGVFPTPEYTLLGESSFGGVGTFGINGDGDEKRIQDKTILYNTFYVGSSAITQSFVGDKKERIFFHIVVLTDFIDTIEYTHQQKLAFSRNHPDYMGEGQYKTKNNTIQYLAFLGANQDSYAIINMRLFNLKNGRTILIAPQKNGSIRSKQIDSPPLTANEIDEYTTALLKKKEIVDFFKYAGNI